MGGHPYWYFVPYQEDLQGALDALRKREFEAGRYNPLIRQIKFSEPAFSKQRPGKGHPSIKKAIEASSEEGTRSILDIARVGHVPDPGVATPLDLDRVRELYDTDKPRRRVVEAAMDFIGDIERGKCVYVILYESGAPTEICFAGHSYD